ncbi:ABC transporter ATP-binding protein [Phytoactinopolyspora halotolerans]|uniref:ABC transporter ATP-binding protein n=2 Tax=Phytoactinopolyspora halotolerans TaxID=1981512 RepID=A0A6L9SFN1_9ACTN|nr:ABC transporter ATP-binding protein [Phytoactinopolyspora halotolerans]
MLVEAHDLWFRYGKEWTLAELELSVESSATLGIVGESGSGKSTLVRLLCGLITGASGTARYDGRDITEWLRRDAKQFRRHNQIVFQNPASSLDPRMRIRTSLTEPVKALERRVPTLQEIEQWLALVGLGSDVLARYPHQLSGGQLQRIAIARALSVNPTVLYADEPTSALDVSVQAQVLNLLMNLRQRLGLTLVMVSHDLAIVGRMSEQMIVMKSGRIVESGPTLNVMHNPQSDYTRTLIEAAQAVSLPTTGVYENRLANTRSGHATS